MLQSDAFLMNLQWGREFIMAPGFAGERKTEGATRRKFSTANEPLYRQPFPP
jgi:hypothetical protein